MKMEKNKKMDCLQAISQLYSINAITDTERNQLAETIGYGDENMFQKLVEKIKEKQNSDIAVGILRNIGIGG